MPAGRTKHAADQRPSRRIAVVAVLLGIAFVDERLTWNLIIGTAMILVGLWVAERNPDEREVASEPLKLPEDEARGWERI